MSRPTGRPLKPRSDTERLELLVELLSFGRARRNVEIHWDGSLLSLCACEPGYFYKQLVDGVDLRELLDRAISLKVTAKKRARRKVKP